ncbi:MAG TPA: MCP four helix bundle domain-containing protein [Tenuifilaceae bacterium]|nr:MCP four helix bundle domain-containing protein [Tenuifilaceae bacterium]HPJ47099.1 MCP four helix bundle domain-containing protein [Tenuifilaceae bacterium]HRX68297.1 MCP four helix bundle domain-containing protein [Tenuifilaceae bacterium]
MSIRFKILIGFLILASMLFISGAFSIFELTRQGRAVKLMIADSYQSIDYAKQMLDALDHQENSLLYHIGTKDSLVIGEFESASNLFDINLRNAGTNLTHEEERTTVDSITHFYKIYMKRAMFALQCEKYNFNAYLDSIQSSRIKTKNYVKKLMIINQEELYQSAAFHEASAQRALLPGLIVIITSLLFTFIFIYLVNHYFVSPILKITKAVNDFVKYHKAFDVPLETKDEIFSLKEAIGHLISYTKTIKKDE